MSENIENRLKRIISQLLNIPADKIQASTHFSKDLNADSTDKVDLIMSVEEEFKISIPDQEAEKIESFKQLMTLVRKKLSL